MRVSVNLSAINLHDPNLIPYLREKLEQNNVSPERLTLEITESAVMNDPVMAQKVLTELKEMGVTLVIDDYGTGLSSLAYLKSLPVKCLKIDKSFVMEMLTNENDSIIIRSTIDMAHNLGLTVVAEGVENKETLSNLSQLKCDFVQGYYVAQPMLSEDLIKWMANYSVETHVV
jgi:EAL domain-containing protein (putative c-di-GMP-specific phosphodiesterase class I)